MLTATPRCCRVQSSPVRQGQGSATVCKADALPRGQLRGTRRSRCFGPWLRKIPCGWKPLALSEPGSSSQSFSATTNSSKMLLCWQIVAKTSAHLYAAAIQFEALPTRSNSKSGADTARSQQKYLQKSNRLVSDGCWAVCPFEAGQNEEDTPDENGGEQRVGVLYCTRALQLFMLVWLWKRTCGLSGLVREIGHPPGRVRSSRCASVSAWQSWKADVTPHGGVTPDLVRSALRRWFPEPGSPHSLLPTEPLRYQNCGTDEGLLQRWNICTADLELAWQVSHCEGSAARQYQERRHQSGPFVMWQASLGPMTSLSCQRDAKAAPSSASMTPRGSRSVQFVPLFGRTHDPKWLRMVAEPTTTIGDGLRKAAASRKVLNKYRSEHDATTTLNGRNKMDLFL